jgi:hypothetical protein
METALRVVSDWALNRSMELTNIPVNIFVDNPTDQAYVIKSYIDVHKDIQVYLDDLDFEELMEGLMKN